MRHKFFCHFWLFFVLLPLSLPSPIPLTTPENQIFEKMKNTPPKIISYNENKNENHMMHGSWDMERDRIFSHFGRFFGLLPPKKTENQNFEKKTTKNLDIILHNCTLNDNHMMYDSWDMKPNRHNIFVILDILPFYPTNNPKTQNFEKMKKTPGDISSFYTGVPEIMIICYKIPEIWHEIIFIFHFGLFFPFYPPNSPKNHNFKKVKIFFIILQMCTKNCDQMIYSSWDPVRDGWL